MNNRGMYYELYDVLGKFYDIGRYNERERKYRFSTKHNDEEVSFGNTRQALEMTAITTKKVFEILKELYEFLESKDLESEGFLTLKSRMNRNATTRSMPWRIQVKTVSGMQPRNK